MSFVAQEQKIRKIFSGETKFAIPHNQRKYVWDEKHWKELLSDIQYIYEQKVRQNKEISHFFGSFVLQEEADKYVVIDGQQSMEGILMKKLYQITF